MGVPSGTFTFAASESRVIIEDAYRRTGMVPSALTQEQIESAQISANLILASWLNRGINLFTVKQDMLQLIPMQATYNLPTTTSTVLEVTLRTSQRNLGGTAFSSSGVAGNSFNGVAGSACTQNAINGNIGYEWAAANQYNIQLVGVQSNADINYSLVFEVSSDGSTWEEVGAPPAQLYEVAVINWFVITAPVFGSFFRIRETAGATLNMQQLYFNTALNDLILSAASRSEYMTYPNKNLVGRPSLFYFNRDLAPTITLWPVPSAQYNNLYYTRIEEIEDVGTLQNNIAVPSRFYAALTWQLAHSLASKMQAFDLNKLNLLYNYGQEEFKLASEEDTERVPIRIYPDVNGYLFQ